MSRDRVKDALTRLKAIGDVRPDMAPVVKVAAEVVEAAQADVEKATRRAELAEQTVAAVQPQLDGIASAAASAEAELDELKAELAAREELDAERDVAASRMRIMRSIDSLGQAVAALVKSREGLADRVVAAIPAETVEKLAAAHFQVEPSLLLTSKRYGRFVVKSYCGRFTAVCESRKDALQAVDEVIALRKAQRSGAVDVDDDEDE